MAKKLLALSISLTFLSSAKGQSKNFGQISGNFQANFQYYLKDTLIDPTAEAYPDERLLAAGFLNLTYIKNDFIAGMRYENYQNNLVGLPKGYKGEGIAYRYLRYIKNKVDITAGNFYEQFGSGLVLRTYEERGLGLDNNFDGMRIIFAPREDIVLKGLIGRQRNFFEKSKGIVRGVDAEWNLGKFLLSDDKTNLIIGASFVSKYQRDEDPFYNLPENVATGAFRVNLITGNFNIFGEYAYKSNDPSTDNSFIYKPGSALFINTSYAKGNLGASLGVKQWDNFSFRSERTTDPQQLLINYLPPLTTLHTYALPALYSFNTVPTGEVGLQAEVSYNFKKGTTIGGKYGTLITLSFANSYGISKDFTPRPVYSPIDTSIVGKAIDGTNGYSSSIFRLGPFKYFQDFHAEIKKKLSKSWKAIFTYYNFDFNNSVLRKGVSDYNLISSDKNPEILQLNAGVLEWLYKIKPRHSLRSEWQLLLTEDDRGNWALVLLEYSIAPKWFFAFQDAYNYGNPNKDLRIHYINFNLGYTIGITRFQLGYGRQQEGVFCVGGICRIVPASKGFSLNITSNF